MKPSKVSIKKANQLYYEKKYGKALKMYQKIIRDNPKLASSLDLNIKLAQEKVNQNLSKSVAKKLTPFNIEKVDILVTIWLSGDEPIHNIIIETLNFLESKCFTSKIFAPNPLIERVYKKFPNLLTQQSSIYLSDAKVPQEIILKKSFIEDSKHLIEYFLKLEEKWLVQNRDGSFGKPIKDKIINGIRYWTQVITTHSPKLMLIWGSSSPVSTLLIEICKAKSIKYQIIERGLLPGTLIMDDNAQFGYSYSNHLLSATTSTRSTIHSHLNHFNSYLRKVSAIPYKEFNDNTSENLLKTDQPIVLFIGSNDLGAAISLHDTFFQPLNVSVYKSSQEVVWDLAESLPLLDKNIQFIIKPHPADKTDYSILEGKSNINILRKDNINNLIDKATICCTLCSTAIAICLLKKKPVVTFSSSDISGIDIAYEVYRKSELFSQLRNAFLKINFEEKTSNADTYFSFASNYRLYFESKFHEYGHTPLSLSNRISKILYLHHKRLYNDSTQKIQTLSTPVFFSVDKKLTIQPPPVDIIIPIYDGFKITKACIDYAINVATSCQNIHIILINDCSPNSQIVKYIDELSSIPRDDIKIHSNKINTGYSGAVNIGISFSRPSADILLLNSDALISTHLVRSLQATAFSNPRIATVCPLSTDGGLMTIPLNVPDNYLFNQNDLNHIDSTMHESNNRLGLLLPINHGACLYIKKSALHIVGVFNEFEFGRGYSEEIDFCLRLRNHGFYNVGCCFAFVHHVGQISFGEHSNPLKIKNRRIIEKKYPHYFAEIRNFISEIKNSDKFTEICKKLGAIVNEII